jgi:hypothetical protein
MVMHWLSLARNRNSDFEHAHEWVLENNFVAIWRCLHRVEPSGELRFVLCVKIKMTAEQCEKTYDGDNRQPSNFEGDSWLLHSAEYIDVSLKRVNSR